MLVWQLAAKLQVSLCQSQHPSLMVVSLSIESENYAQASMDFVDYLNKI